MYAQKTNSKCDKLSTNNYKCEYLNCNEEFNNISSLISHVSDHAPVSSCNPSTKGADLNCKWKDCDATITQGLLMMKRHLFFHVHHSKLKRYGIEYTSEKKLNIKCLFPHYDLTQIAPNFICKWKNCNVSLTETFEMPEQYYDHVDEHAENNPKGNNLSIKVSCNWSDCSLQFSSVYKLKEHLRTHTKQRVIACPVCGTMFASRTKFFDHLKRQETIEHASSSVFKCEYCYKAFRSERLLKEHFIKHVNQHKCPHCEMTCATINNLNRHIVFCHSKEKPFPCKSCNYRAKTEDNLKKHVLTHKQTKRPQSKPAKFRCHICDKIYKSGSYLSKHLSGLHKLKWPPGHRRFRYVKGTDDVFTLLQTRLELSNFKDEIVRDRESNANYEKNNDSSDSTSVDCPN